MESVFKNNIFGLKMMMKNCLEKFILKSLQCGKCDYYLPGVAGGAGAGVSATGLAGA